MANFRTINLADIYNAADQTNTNRMRNQLMQMEMQKAQRGEQEEQALRGAYAFTPEGGLDEQTTLANLYKVAPQKAYEFQQGVTKSRSEQAKLERENTAADVTNRVAKSKYLRDVLAGVTDQASYENALQEANSLGAGFMTQNAPAQFNPEWVRGHVMDADKFLTQNTPKFEKVDLGGRVQVIDVNPVTNPQIRGTQLDKTASPEAMMTDLRARQEGALNRGVSLRGQDLTDARAREASRVAAGKVQNEKLTEGMRSTGQYAARMQAAEDLLANTVEQKPGVMEKVAGEFPLIGSETSANLLRSPDRQKSLQAQRDWVRAKLRKESGAAIGVDEMKNEILTYFPQIGDSDEVIEQKKAARSQAVEGLINSAGGAYVPPTASASNKQLDRIPSPSQVPKGAIITDTKTGQRMQSDGKKWIRL